MQAWIEKLMVTVNMLLGQPATPVQFWVLLGSSSLIGMVVLHKAADLVGAAHAEIERAILTYVVSVVLLVGGLTLSGVWVMPRLSGALLRWAVPGTIVAVSAVLILPWLCAVHRMNYFSAAIAWFLCLVAVWGVLAVGRAGLGLGSAFRKDAAAVRERGQAVHEYLQLLGR